MYKNKPKNINIRSDINTCKKFFHLMGVKPYHIITLTFLSFIIAFFGGIGKGLLIPLARGIANNDFSFLAKLPIFNKIIIMFPQYFGRLLTQNMSTFLFIAIMIFAAELLKNILQYTSSLISAYWGGRFSVNINNFIFSRYLSFGKLFFDRINQGYLRMVLRYSRGASILFELLQKTSEEFLMLIVHLAIMAMISWRLTIFTIIVFPCLHYVLRWTIIRVNAIARAEVGTRVELNKKIFNILSSIPLVKAYSKEEEAKERYIDINENERKLRLKSAIMRNLLGPIQGIVILITLLSLLLFAVLVLKKRANVAELSIFIVFFYVATRTLPAFGFFNRTKMVWAKVKPKLEEVIKILDDKDKFFVPEGQKEFKRLKRNIEFRHINFSYEGVQVLKDVTFSIEKGKMAAIVGPTGSGKTTLINLILRFYDCTPFSIMIDDIDIRDFTLKSLRTHIALVSQDPLLFNDTLKNNIAYGLDGELSDEKLIDVVKKARLYDFIMSLPNGFDTYVGDRGIKLSGGEKQRISIARALLKDPQILILDEATSSLDTKTEELIQEAIDEVSRDKTAIVITHRLSTIKDADKIIVIEEGRVIEQSSLNELLEKKGRFYNYWKDQGFH